LGKDEKHHVLGEWAEPGHQRSGDVSLTTNQPPKLAPINAETTVSVIARRLRDAIAEGNMPPGTRLTEQELAEQLNVSRGPLREAIQRLVQEGIVTNIPHRGAFVTELDEQDIVDLYVARYACESTAVRLLMAAPKSTNLDQLGEIVDQLAAALASSDWELARKLDLSFHEGLVQAASNTHLNRMFETLKVETMLCLAGLESLYPEESQLADEHTRVLDALRAGDVDAAIAELRDHMSEGAGRLSGTDFPL
jgi:DNA-binding GntR family transcriptional regulator